MTGSVDKTADAVAAQLAWWWRMTQTDDLDDPRSEASWWNQAAQVAISALRREESSNAWRPTPASRKLTIGAKQERIFCIDCGKYRVLTKKRGCRVCGARIVSIKWRLGR